MKFKARPLADFDNYQLGLIDASNAKRLISAWVDAIPANLFGFSSATETRDALLRALRMRYTSDQVEYQVVDPDLDELTLNALGDHLRAFVLGWTRGFSRREDQLIESL